MSRRRRLFIAMALAAAAAGSPLGPVPVGVDPTAAGAVDDLPRPEVTNLEVGTRSATIAWQPPAGVTVQSWTVQVAGPTPMQRTVRGDITSMTFAGLAPGTPHSVRITGYPRAQTSPTRVTLSTLAMIPAPRIGRVAATETGLSVEFFRPVLRGTTVLEAYTVRAGDQTQVLAADSTVNRYLATFNDLPRATTVTVTVTASVARDVDPVSPIARKTVTLRTLDPPPTARLTARNGGIGVVVRRSPGVSGQLPVSGYVVTAGGVTVITGVDGRALLDGLEGDTSYPVEVTTLRGELRGASSIVGEMQPLPAAAPAAPQHVRMTLPNARQPVFRWDAAPVGTVDRYEVYADDRLEATVDGRATAATLRTSSLLPAPTSFRVVAVNGFGTAATTDITREDFVTRR